MTNLQLNEINEQIQKGSISLIDKIRTVLDREDMQIISSLSTNEYGYLREQVALRQRSSEGRDIQKLEVSLYTYE